MSDEPVPETPTGPKSITYDAVRVVLDPSRAPRQAHRFSYTRVGTDMVLDVGYHDLSDLSATVDAAKNDPDSKREIPFFVTDRFVLSVTAAKSFIETAEFIRQDLTKLQAALAAQLQKTKGE